VQDPPQFTPTWIFSFENKPSGNPGLVCNENEKKNLGLLSAKRFLLFSQNKIHKAVHKLIQIGGKKLPFFFPQTRKLENTKKSEKCIFPAIRKKWNCRSI
jgi:hypothetical protein